MDRARFTTGQVTSMSVRRITKKDKRSFLRYSMWRTSEGIHPARERNSTRNPQVTGKGGWDLAAAQLGVESYKKIKLDVNWDFEEENVQRKNWVEADEDSTPSQNTVSEKGQGKVNAIEQKTGTKATVYVTTTCDEEKKILQQASRSAWKGNHSHLSRVQCKNLQMQLQVRKDIVLTQMRYKTDWTILGWQKSTLIWSFYQKWPWNCSPTEEANLVMR